VRSCYAFGVRPALLAMVLAAACGNTTAAPARVDATAPAPATQPAAAAPAVVFDGGARVAVTIARTPTERERGLMYVNYLPPNDGMLFIFDRDEPLLFWMKNTLIPLDMVFVSSDMTVAGVVANAKPLTLETRGVEKPCRYVVETNGGWAAAHGVGPGSKVRFENIP
jgi:uncharacterized membrane protein (UPF0127 family)